MGSPGCEALYMGPPLHPHPDPLRPWHHHHHHHHHHDDITEDVKPPRGLLGLPDPPPTTNHDNNSGWPGPGTGVYHHHHLPSCCDRLVTEDSRSPPPWHLKDSSLSPPPWHLKDSSLSPPPWHLKDSSLSPPPWHLKDSSLSPPPWHLKDSSLSPPPTNLLKMTQTCPLCLTTSSSSSSSSSSSKSPEPLCPIHHHHGTPTQGGGGTPPSSAELEDMQVEEGCLEAVQSLVVGEVLKDIDTACKLLSITAEPMEWSCLHVQKWLLWTEHLYRLPQVCKVFAGLSGKDLCSLTEEQFRQRSAQCGAVMFHHLDIWRSAAGMKERCPLEDGKAGAEDPWPEEGVPGGPQQPIHLWQFLRELLLKPHSYSRSIRWINKETGIFKIEDSAQVARLWGVRKNRPAMNYDKLSRSIRQYYRKGIIRKPDVSRRLVYQFVNPV